MQELARQIFRARQSSSFLDKRRVQVRRPFPRLAPPAVCEPQASECCSRSRNRRRPRATVPQRPGCGSPQSPRAAVRAPAGRGRTLRRGAAFPSARSRTCGRWLAHPVTRRAPEALPRLGARRFPNLWNTFRTCCLRTGTRSSVCGSCCTIRSVISGCEGFHDAPNAATPLRARNNENRKS